MRYGRFVQGLISSCILVGGLGAQEPPAPAPEVTATESVSRESAEEPPWQTLGLLRVRDMTPFGMSRLDMLPAHAVAATPGTFAVEVTTNYQNTWAISDNVQDYLTERGQLRGPITATDVAALLAKDEEVYLVDGEVGLVDLTLHYRFSSHFGIYATLPYFYFGSGAFDSTIESFHEAVGFSNAGREFVPLDQFQVVADLEAGGLVLAEAPDAGFGDPVLGARYSLVARPEWGNLVVEAAWKIATGSEERLVSTGEDDSGVQISFQRFFRRNALYLSLAGVYLGAPDRSQRDDPWLPTVVAGWETRMTRHTNFILQGYWSESVFQKTELEELSADKLQATIGVQWLYEGNVLRFGVTENLANFDNTPDVGVTLSYGRVLFGD